VVRGVIDMECDAEACATRLVCVSIVVPFWEWDRKGVQAKIHERKAKTRTPSKTEGMRHPREFQSWLVDVRCRAEECATRPSTCHFSTPLPNIKNRATRADAAGKFFLDSVPSCGHY
jgi:hypothetical protein